MKWLLRLPSAYLSLPILFACGLTCLTYDLPAAYLEGIVLLAATAFAIMLFDVAAGLRLPAMERFRTRQYAGTRESFVALMFAGLIAFFCLLDLLLFPIPLISDPTSYATMSGGHEHVRHVSDMCWVLPPIGLLCVRSKWLRASLIAVGLLFPILVIDRNRVFAALFSSGLVVVWRRQEAKQLPWKTMGFLAILGGGIFSMLGILRSGTLDYVTLPFSDMFRSSPQGVKWLLLYATAGTYNFGAMLAKHYSNATFLFNQLVPMSGSVATAGTDIPLDASNINIGTEFFPFLMAFGPLGAVVSIVALYALQLWSVRRLLPAVPLFSLLIFLRVSYVCLMSPFAPQAFTWTNFGFIAVCLFLQVFASLLPNRKAQFSVGEGQGVLPLLATRGVPSQTLK